VLGKILFWDEQLSSDDTVACGTCHRPAAGGADPRALTTRHPGPDGIAGSADDPHGSAGIVRCVVGASGEIIRVGSSGGMLAPSVTRRKAPSYLDAMHFAELFWDGRARSAFVDPETGEVAIAAGGALESQAVGPPMNDGEMACEQRSWADVRRKLAAARPLARARNLPPDVDAALCRWPSYPQLFEAAFGTPEITARRIAFAIATHERRLHSSDTPWDRTQRGDAAALSPAEERGRVLFFGKGLCARCHPAPQFGGAMFVNLGFNDPSFDHGRQDVTQDPLDLGRFQSATARNAGLREAAGLLHDGTGHGATLVTLMRAYNNPPGAGVGGGFANTDPRMRVGLGLSDTEVDDLVAFVRTGLTDPRVAAERPPFDRPRLSTE